MTARRTAGLLLALLLLAGCGSSRQGRQVVEPEGGRVVVDLRPIGPGSGRFFSYRSPRGGRADFLVYRESGGEPRAVLDACADCYRWRKGYRLEGSEVVCVKCGMRFGLDELAQGVGACVPLPLASEPEGDRLAIPVEALEEATRYF